ncbi:hypothetical protein [Thiohalorhabdus sp.]|uniref:hypothetical protein n=1 Tax=Thiohalorhabdus sp. TaxID=3094134 RepID=UPI002FC3982B
MALIRVSALPQYPDCPRRTAAKLWRKTLADAGYELRDLPQHVGGATGTGTHEAGAYALSERRDGREANQQEAEQRGLQALEDAIQEGVVWDGTTPNLNTAQKQVLRQYHAYRDQIIPHTSPVEVEARFKATTPNGHTLSGQVDVLDQAALRDTKTGNYQRVNVAQYGGYSLLLRSNGMAVPAIYEDFIRRVKVKEPQPPVEPKAYPVETAERVAWGIIQRMEADLADFERTGQAETFLANPTSMLCSPDFCPAFGTAFCPESQYHPKHTTEDP